MSSKWFLEHWTQRPKRHLLNKNFLPFQDGNHVFGAQTMEMSEITWWNENLKNFSLTKKKPDQTVIKIAFQAFCKRFER